MNTHQIKNNIVVKQVDMTHFNKPNVNMFIDLVYQHFIDLAKYPDLKHTVSDITKLIRSPNFEGYLVYKDGKKIIGYLLGDNMVLVDGRKVFYISYMFVAPSFRSKGIASQLMELSRDRADKKRYDGLLLTADSNNEKVFDFYLKRGFMPDLVLRKYDQHEILFQPLS